MLEAATIIVAIDVEIVITLLLSTNLGTLTPLVPEAGILTLCHAALGRVLA